MKWTKKEMGILGGCILLAMCLILYGALNVAPQHRHESIVREVLEKIYTREETVFLKLDELSKSMAGSTVVGKEDDGIVSVEGYGLADYLKERFGKYFTELGYENFAAMNYPMGYYVHQKRTGEKIFCEGLEVKEDEKVKRQYSMRIHLVKEDIEGNRESITDTGGVRFDEEDKIVYWAQMGKAFD